MFEWKRNIFVNAIKTRMKQEERTKKDVIEEYTALTIEEKAEILAAI